MSHQPAPVLANEEIRRHCLNRVEAGLVNDSDVFGASHPRNVTVGLNRHVLWGDPHLLLTLEYFVPGLSHLAPAFDHIPAGMHASDPLLV